MNTLRAFVSSDAFNRFIVAVIVVNAITLGLETVPAAMRAAGGLILLIDLVCLSIFTAELALKIAAHGPRFFRSGWNWFDLIVVAVAYIPGNGGLSVLRALRILRVLRLVSAFPRLRRVVEGFFSALPGMASVFLLMALIFYMASVMATKFFAATHPEWFGDIGRSAYSLFQIMTLESWSMGIVRPIMEIHPWAWAFFVPFILATTFAVVNLLVGLIVNSMQDAHGAEEAEATDAYRDEVLDRLKAIEARLDRDGR
ncbi:ion transporter [Jannaschia sp. Os4]|uniref:ion transporter n=1 Tax=Jannaschia sp. Os4 TaxID=2807617 RepID=UPI00193936A1|nr:ion transporter [Jannaschia sp. Os4]MBM2575400.1 ion transporter [Jannaschia sp. Os4]